MTKVKKTPYQARRENPIQYALFFSSLALFYCLELVNYIPHAFLRYLHDYTYYQKIYDFPVLEEVLWMLDHPRYKHYANAYAEYIVWGTFLNAMVILALLVALCNLFIKPPRPRGKFLMLVAIFIFADLFLFFSTTIETNHFDGRGAFSGLHMSIPTLIISCGRAALFSLTMTIAIPAFAKNVKQILSDPEYRK
ncbi:MAG: hypothetical protein GY768_31645 [Planctomycetaceae bacterium]|nr:hypothetical protein [Planctomycetaceae bacterium]